MPTTLRLILGDQLDPQHSWFTRVDPDVHYALLEVQSEQTYVRHHVQKVALFFAAMRAFATHLTAAGHHVHYRPITDGVTGFEQGLAALLATGQYQRIEVQAPDEYRLDAQFRQLSSTLGVPVHIVPSEHFLTHRHTAGELFGDAKHWLMERFYRVMRRDHGVLLAPDAQPEGGRWNFDAENRTPAAKAPRHYPPPPRFANDYTSVLADIRAAGLDVFGADAVAPHYPISRAQALQLIDHFVQHALPHFGATQDVMLAEQPLLHHSLLSFALNVKLLRPLEVITAAEAAYRSGAVPLASAEGFIRQILGWREYMRGVYWAKMPHYASTNFFGADRPLPHYFWTGDTRMRCVQLAVNDSLARAYAHHIQRLMVTGNFATLIGVAPAEINAWYLGIYADAIEWVQLPNTHGMSQWADGGLVATKPYVSGGAYLKRMSDSCKGCYYDPEVRTGPRACPFNSLYWNFLVTHTDRLARNPRMAQMYATWRKMNPATQDALLAQAQQVLATVDSL